MYVYCWKDRRYNAIKIGTSPDPDLRMLNYGLALGLNPAQGTLRKFKLKRRTRCRDILEAVHIALRGMGLVNVNGLNELYHLKNRSYEEISSTVMRAVEMAEREWRREMFPDEPEDDKSKLPTTHL